jgi:hypothetical protein
MADILLFGVTEISEPCRTENRFVEGTGIRVFASPVVKIHDYTAAGERRRSIIDSRHPLHNIQLHSLVLFCTFVD